jgi:hypothetical protein
LDCKFQSEWPCSNDIYSYTHTSWIHLTFFSQSAMSRVFPVSCTSPISFPHETTEEPWRDDNHAITYHGTGPACSFAPYCSTLNFSCPTLNLFVLGTCKSLHPLHPPQTKHALPRLLHRWYKIPAREQPSSIATLWVCSRPKDKEWDTWIDKSHEPPQQATMVFGYYRKFESIISFP